MTSPGSGASRLRFSRPTTSGFLGLPTWAAATAYAHRGRLPGSGPGASIEG